jgi:hypothetical protein
VCVETFLAERPWKPIARSVDWLPSTQVKGSVSTDERKKKQLERLNSFDGRKGAEGSPLISTNALAKR